MGVPRHITHLKSQRMSESIQHEPTNFEIKISYLKKAIIHQNIITQNTMDQFNTQN